MRGQIIKDLDIKSAELPNSKQVLLLLIITKLKLKYYNSFCKKHKFGNKAVMKQAAKQIQDLIENKTLNSLTNEQIVSKVKKYIPDTEEFDGLDAQLALDACVCLLNTFEFLKTGNQKYLFQSIESTLDMAQLAIELENKIPVRDADLEQKVFSAQLMKRQVRGLTDLLGELKKNDNGHELLKKRKFIVTYPI